VLTSAGSLLGSIIAGVAAGLQFDPLTAAVASVLAAALFGYARAPRSRMWWSAGVLLVGWAVGDGIRVAGSNAAPGYLAAWAVAGLAFGYVLPAVSGAYIGRLVYRGTGWLAAGAVALMLAPALSVVGDTLSGGLMRLVA
jgi:hypothetical protein